MFENGALTPHLIETSMAQTDEIGLPTALRITPR